MLTLGCALLAAGTPPPSADYALGWNVGMRDWAGGAALSHSGTNTLNFAIIWLAPNKRLGFAIATNVGDDVFERLDARLAPIIDAHIRPAHSR